MLHWLLPNKELREKVEELERNSEANFREIFNAIRQIIQQEEKPKGKIGFKVGEPTP